MAGLAMDVVDLLLGLLWTANSYLSQYEPILILTAPLIALGAAMALHCFVCALQENGIRGVFPGCAKLTPGGSSIESEEKKVVEKLISGKSSKWDSWRKELPSIGLGRGVLENLEEAKSKDVDWQGKCSGTVYIGGSDSDAHFTLLNEAYSMFSHTNPLHPDVFPSLVRFEGEVVAMTAALLGSKEPTSGGQICGNMTCGGTESILLAVKSARDYLRVKKGITKPEMILPASAHPAYEKAAQYFNIKVCHVPVNKEFRADVEGIRRVINKNTIMVVGSAPCYPHGVVDPIEELGELTSNYGICLHVDLCLGGFVLPFARKLGYSIPPFDFSVKGVTSISADVHKYGLAPKGTSIVLYRNRELRKHQFVALTEWNGGLYVSPSIAGSRPGGLIAGAWAAMMSLGLNGYMEITREIMELSKKVQKGIEEIPELFIAGTPHMTIVAFGSDIVNVFEVSDVMRSKGWHLQPTQKPNCLHMCFTLQHVPMCENFLTDLKESVKTVKENPGSTTGGYTAVYGAAVKMPDREMVHGLLIEFMDSSCYP